jgi:hypothetical protein
MVRGLVAASLAVLGACGPSGGKDGVCKDSIVVGDLVITEVFADFQAPAGGTGADEGKEWFEIYNASDRPIDLEGLRIDHSRPDGDKLNSHVMQTVTLAPGQYFTLGNSTPDLIPAYVDYGYSADLGDMFNSDGGKFALSCGDSEIDSALYDSVKSGSSRQLTAATFPDYTLNDDLANWCEAAGAEFEDGNFGTPGGENDCTPIIIGSCNDNGTMRPTVSPQPGELVVTEVMPQPAGDDNLQEWFEAKALASFDLNGLSLDRAGDTAAADTIDSPDCIPVTSGDYVIFVKNSDMTMNGGLPPGSIKGEFDFSLINGSMASPGDLQILSGATLIDAVSWTSSRADKSLSVDPDLEDPTSNDDIANFCDGATSYGAGGSGTPGVVNDQCTLLPPAGKCSEGGNNRDIVKPAAGQLVITEFFANPGGTGTDATGEWFEITNTGNTAFDLNGLGLKGNATTVNLITSADCKQVMPGTFAVFAHTADNTQNKLPMTVTVAATFTFALAASSGSLSVLDGTTPLDAITWPSSPSVPDGTSRMLNPLNTNSTDNDNPANFCDAKRPTQTYDNGPDATLDTADDNRGTPGAVNVCL